MTADNAAHGRHAEAAALVLGSAQEVQSHGLVFERWVRDTFFDGYKPASYTQRWDIPASANRAHGGIPVNPKAVKHGTQNPVIVAVTMPKIEEEVAPTVVVAAADKGKGKPKKDEKQNKK